ncbi:MAG: META domain-containing protein [Microthrixaceae bacterium]
MPRRFLLVLACLAVAACGSDSDSGDTTAPDSTAPVTTVAEGSGGLDGQSFESTTVEGHELVEGSTVLLTFEDGTLSVIAGCNTISGAYSLQGGTLAFEGEPRMTMMGCDQALADQDTWLGGWLTAGVAVTETDGGLQLEGDGVTMDLVAGGEEVDAPLVGVTWTLETISTDATSSNVPASVTAPTIEFAADGTVALTLGCNNGNSTVTTSGDTLTFTVVASTRMACEDDAMTVEAAVTAVIDGEVTFSIDGDRLTLTKGTSSLTYVGA